MTKYERESIAMCEAEGLTGVSVRHRRKHLVIESDQGPITISCTPSDRRSRLNIRAIARRMSKSNQA